MGVAGWGEMGLCRFPPMKCQGCVGWPPGAAGSSGRAGWPRAAAAVSRPELGLALGHQVGQLQLVDLAGRKGAEGQGVSARAAQQMATGAPPRPR